MTDASIGIGYDAVVSYSYGPTRTDWDRLRPVIKRLYIDEEKTLKEVMTIMARDHNHRASPRMYKDRIKRWNLEKKTKEDEAWAMLRKKMQRDAVGKQSAFSLRGKTVTIDDLLRYFKRKGVLNAEKETQNRLRGPPTPTAVECWTPAPSPRTEDKEIGADCLGFQYAEPGDMPYFGSDSMHGSGSLGYLNSDQTRQVLFSDSEIQSFDISSSLLPPQNLLVLERLFGSIKNYLGGAFDNGDFETSDNGLLVSSRPTIIKGSGDPLEFLNLCFSGISSMSSNSYYEGRLLFSKASCIINDILLGLHPQTLECILDALWEMESHGYHQVATLFCVHMRDISAIIFPASHPLHHLFSYIADIEHSQFQFALLEARRYISDTFTHNLGPFHRTALLSQLEFLSRRNDNAPHLQHELLLRAEQELGPSDDRIVTIKYTYAASLFKQGRYAEAVEVLEDVHTRCSEAWGWDYVVVDALDTIVECRFELGVYKESDEVKLIKAIGRIEEIAGSDEPGVLFAKSQLVRRLRRMGREDEARELQREIDDGLGPDDIEVDTRNSWS